MDTLEKILIATGLDRDEAKDGLPIVRDYIAEILVEYVEEIQVLKSVKKELIALNSKQNTEINGYIEEIKSLKEPLKQRLLKYFTKKLTYIKKTKNT